MSAPDRPEIERTDPGHVPAGYLTEHTPSPWGSRPVHWALTAAVLAAVVCGVGWPRPTLYAVGAVTGAVALVVGIRGLIRGPKSRTTPAEQQASTVAHGGPIRAQDVDDLATAAERSFDRVLAEAQRRQRAARETTPGDLRSRVAAALRDHGMVHLGDGMPADEYDCCADAVLADLAPELAERRRP